MFYLLFLLFTFVNGWKILVKQENNKEVRYIFKTQNSSSVGFIRYIDGNIYLADLNYSNSVGARRFNNIAFIVAPRGDNTTNPILAREIREEFIATYNSTYFTIVGKNNDYMIITGGLLWCATPMVTHVNVKTHLIFNGTRDFTSSLQALTSATQEVYENGSYSIQIVANSYQNYSINYYYSSSIIDYVSNLTTYPLLNNVTYQFASGNNYTLDKIPGQWNDILSPYVPTLADYTLNTLTPFYNRAAYCNYHQGGYDAIGNLIFPYTVDGVSGGGFMDFTFGDLVKIPIEVPADPQYEAFQQDCTTFYPKSTTFQGFGISGNDGATYERMQQDQERCYAPFYRPEAIVPPGGSEIQNERFRQCFMLGGMTSGLSRDVCWKGIGWAWCKAGLLYFGGYCYLKPNPILNADTKVVLDESTFACDSFGIVGLQPLVYTTPDINAFLKEHYTYYQQPSENASTTYYRTSSYNTECLCYYPGNVTTCNCQVQNFPICRYYVGLHEIVHRWDYISPKTTNILKYGQKGAKFPGQMLSCTCYNGWRNENCSEPTCPFPTSTTPNDPQSQFFSACYANGHGYCVDNDPRVCQCVNGYTPFGNLLNNTNTEFPCACPATFQGGSERLSIVNNETYNFEHAACGGRWQGTCTVDAFSNFGECDCIQRTRLAASFNLELEYAYNGKACSCVVPRVFTYSDIEQTACNAKGTCCPFGQRADGSTGYCPPEIDGCVCDNGWNGTACTCIAPFNLVSSLPFTQPGPVQFIWCASDYFLIDFQPHNCTKYASEKFYCQQVPSGPLYLKTITNCTFLEAVYNEWFEVGGNNTNPFSARFSERKENRYYNNYLEVQPWYFAIHGCTNTKGMCDANHTGIGCFMGISNTVTKAVCGETTQPPRGNPQPNFKCQCNELGVNGFYYGDACEVYVYNNEICAGHGIPTPTNFPYGVCSGDIHLNDSLYNPYFFKQNDLDEFNPWSFREASIISDLSINVSYSFRNTYTTVFMFKTYGTNFTTCEDSIKPVLNLSMDQAFVSVVQFDLLLYDGSHVIVPVLRGYMQCTGLNQTTYYNGTITRPNCYVSYTVDVLDNTTSLNGERPYELTCVDAFTILPLINYPYGKLYCNVNYNRVIDKALWIHLGESQYTLQCQDEPIKPYVYLLFYLAFFYSSRLFLLLSPRHRPTAVP